MKLKLIRLIEGSISQARMLRLAKKGKGGDVRKKLNMKKSVGADKAKPAGYRKHDHNPPGGMEGVYSSLAGYARKDLGRAKNPQEKDDARAEHKKWMRRSKDSTKAAKLKRAKAMSEGSLGLKKLQRAIKAANKDPSKEEKVSKKIRAFTNKERRRAKGETVEKIQKRPPKHRNVTFAKGKMKKYGDGDDNGTMKYRAARDHSGSARGRRVNSSPKGRDDA
jgi:hypothetical protein